MYAWSKRVVSTYLIMSLSVVSSCLAVRADAWVEPLAAGRNIKITLSDGSMIVGKLKVWDKEQVVISDAGQGDIVLAPEQVDNAKYILGDVSAAGSSTYQKTAPAIPGQPVHQDFGPANDDVTAPSSTKRDIAMEKADWQKRINGARIGQTVALISGIGGSVAGLWMYIDGDNQRRNAKFVQKGFYLTNEDDVNAGNEKVRYGYLIMALGGTLIALGIAQGNNVHNLEYEGEQRGFSLSPEIKRDYSGLRLSWKY